ncbi:MAG: hypothetical protein AAFV53_23725 [Myxococcota bacterium]
MLFLILFMACGDPGEITQTVGYRDGADGGATSGERGTVKISEVLWSGSVTNAGVHDPTDIFIELRNESARPINIVGWQLELEVDGVDTVTWILPEMSPDPFIGVGQHVFITAKTTGCFPSPNAVIPSLSLPFGDPFRLTLLDADERLMEPMGSANHPPYAGGYDLVRSRSMEKVELMFGGRGTDPSAWHYYTPAEVDVPNNEFIATDCRENTLASPGFPNSPDYSGAYSVGSFE